MDIGFRTHLKTSLALTFASIGIATATISLNASPPPNIIFILADDMGYNDTSFNGQTHFTTPHLDQMAAEGMVFTDHYAGSTVCAPSRAALLTGNHTGNVFQRGNRTRDGANIQFRRDPHDITIASRLKEAGYHTAMIGKSGLACVSDDASLPNDKGFDHFFGFLSHRNAHRFYPPTLYRNGEVVNYPNNHGYEGDTYSGDEFLAETLGYLEERKKTGEPFFLHLALQQPHADLAVPEKFRNQFIDKFIENPQPHGGYRQEPHPAATYAGMITYLDDTVGQVLAKLRELSIASNTLVIFSSDNGSYREGGYHFNMHNSNHPFRGGKRDLYEGGIRVPTLAWWPGTIEAGSQSNHLSAFWDFPPTALELAGLTIPDSMDGISYLPTLIGNHNQQKQHKYLYWEFHEQGGKQAVRHGKWKGVRLNAHQNPNAPIELYNLAIDPGESANIAHSHPETVELLNSFMHKAHQPSELFKF